MNGNVQLDQTSKALRPLSLDVDVQRTILFRFVVLTALYLFIFLILQDTSIFLKDPDVYWHVAVGRMIWQTKTFPQVDDLSYTFSGHPWIAKEWLGQLFFFGAYTLAGWRGVALLAATVVALSYALLFFVLARSMRLSVAVGISVAAFIFSIGHFNARPQVFADPLIVIWFASLVRAVEEKRSPNPLLWLVMIVWANLHASFTFGLAIAGLLAVEAFFDSASEERPRVAKQWAMFLTIAFGAACLTPYGFQPVLLTFKVFGGNEAVRYTLEWQPTTFEVTGLFGPMLLALLFLALYHGVRLPFWRLSAFIFVLYLMLSHIRFTSLFAIVAPILLAAPLTSQFSSLRLSNQVASDPAFFARMTRVSKRWLYPVCSAIVAGVFAFGVFGPTMAPRAEMTPAGAVDYIYEHRLTGNIYNPLNFGGYLIFRGIKTFIDGRTDQLFLEGFMTNQMEVIKKNPAKLVSYLQQYNIALAVVLPNSIEAQELERSPDWKKVYSESVSELYQRLSPISWDQTGDQLRSSGKRRQ